MKHINDVFTTPKKSYTCHSGLHYNGKNFYDKSIHIKMMLDTDFHWFHCSRRHSPDSYRPWSSSDLCDARRSGSSVALPSFDFASCIEFHQFYLSRRHLPNTTLVFFKYMWYKNKHISNTVIVRLRFLYTIVQFN